MSNDLIASLRALAEKHPRTVRSAARWRQPLDGADAQALEGALTMTEIERNEARAEVERLRAENEMLRADAMRYRWLRAQPKLRLESDDFQSYWIREDGSKFHSSHRLSAKDTRYGIYETLDETIDRAIKVDGKEFI